MGWMISGRTRKREGPSPARRLLVGTFALALAAAGIALAARAFRPEGIRTTGRPAPRGAEPRLNPPLPGEPRITAEIPLPDGAFGGGVAVGAGSAWVGLSPQGRDRVEKVIRIDLATNEIVAEIPVRDTPWRGGIAATADAV